MVTSPPTSARADKSAAGNLLFTRQQSAKEAKAFLAVGIGLILLGFVFPFLFGPTGWLGTILCAMFGLGVLVAGLLKLRESSQRYEIYDWGIRQLGRAGERKVRWEDLKEIVCKMERSSVAGVAGKTHHHLKLVTEDGKTIALHDDERFSVGAGPGSQTQATNIMELASGRMAQDMATRLKSGLLVPWVKGMSFESQGLIFEGKLIPWEKIRCIPMLGNWMIGADRKQRANVAHETPNFFPGFYLIQAMGGKVADEWD